MTCKETRQTLSLYVDDCVSLPARVAIDEHLDRCPVCRAEVADLRSLTRSLNMMTRPTAPAGLSETISDLLTIEAAARQTPKLSLSRRVARFLEPRLMPYSVGSFASVILFFLMFIALRPHFEALREAALQSSSVYVVQTGGNLPGYDLYQPVDSKRFANERAPWGEESPSLNPDGALAAFTRVYVRAPVNYKHGDADDMIVGAVVFRDGTASIVDVVQAPRDRRMLDGFESALRQRVPPFVPASFDRRPDTMKFYFALGTKVEVDDQTSENAN